jgi:hypothetical protein
MPKLGRLAGNTTPQMTPVRVTAGVLPAQMGSEQGRGAVGDGFTRKIRSDGSGTRSDREFHLRTACGVGQDQRRLPVRLSWMLAGVIRVE